MRQRADGRTLDLAGCRPLVCRLLLLHLHLTAGGTSAAGTCVSVFAWLLPTFSALLLLRGALGASVSVLLDGCCGGVNPPLNPLRLGAAWGACDELCARHFFMQAE